MELAGYEFGEIVGQGGMATVYQGLQLSLRRKVAIKVLDEQLQAEPEIRRAFEREALIIARLSHPNIIPVIDRGVSAQGTPCFVMEYVDGVDLSRVMREGRLGLTRKLELLLQISRALAYAHRNGVVHRDIKPSNIIVDKDWHLRVVDFGIAMLYRDGHDTSSELVMGTEAYMAPEIKKSASRATALSDIYAFGVVAYELLSGVVPGRGLKPPSQFDRDIGVDIDRLVLQCLAPDPDKRPQRSELVVEQLLLALSGAHIDQRRVAKAKEVVRQKSFKLLDVLAEKPNRATYLFLETKTRHRYVVKKLPANHHSLAQWRRIASLKLPQWVRVQGVSANGNSSVVVTDYLPGGRLSERLSSPLSVAQFLPWARQIADGLAQAHAQEVWHGAVGSDCVFLDGQERVYIGAAADKSDGDLRSKKTSKKVSSADVNYWFDVNAAGALFYQMLIGESPRYHHGRLKVGNAFTRLPHALQALIKWMLADAAQSPVASSVDQWMPHVRQQLDSMEQDLPTQVWQPQTKTETPEKQKQSEQKKWLLFLLLVLFFLVLMDVGVIVFLEQY
ncbi:MAG: protein kinase domain-containing protein [Cellvibrionaceae bacterium]